MRLKRVRIFGFKTFADRTEVNLDGGIIAVVGPNGCGKSNLVDAILWALGESNARHLRAAASHEVIFSGSSRRRPLGFAEVTLLFDNEDGLLPIDTPEVAVTRRLSRGGESDYFINHRSCRQRDVHELLADSGLGRAGYAIVGQKDIDQALAASPEDRRAWVDEAAGVQRYRLRKVESQKRLANASEHLIRVDDILRELDAQREPLCDEAEIARNYRAAVEALREIETGLLIKDLAKSAREVSALEERLNSSATLVRKENERAEALDLQTVEIREKVAAAEHRMEGIRARLQEEITAMERLDGSARLGEERLRSLDELEITLRAGDSEHIASLTETELEASRQEVAQLEVLLTRTRQDLGGVDDEARSLAEKLKQAEQLLTEARQAESQRIKRKAEREHRRERRVLASRELRGLDQDLPVLTKARDDASDAAEAASQACAGSQAAVAADELALTESGNENDALGVKARALLAEMAALEGRRRGIEATLQLHEGLAQGSRAVLAASEAGDLPGTGNGRMVPIGEAIQTDKESVLAVETALGAAVNDLVVEDEAVAVAAIRLLKEKRLGRATLLPRSRMQAHNWKERPRTEGAWASELVQCEESLRPVIECLLGRVLVVENFDAALKVANTGDWTRIVTWDGEVVDSNGAVSGGLSGKVHHGLVERKADLAEIGRELERLVKEHEDVAKLIAARDAARQELKAKSEAQRKDMEVCRQALSEAKAFLHALDSELHAASRSREKLMRELETLAEDIPVESEIDVEELQTQRDTLFDSLANRSADANQSKERLRDVEGRLQQARNRAAAVARRLEAARHSESQRAAKLRKLEPERDRIRGEINRAKADYAQGETAKNLGEAELGRAQVEKDGLLQEGIRASEEAKTVRANVAAMADANHQAELGRARAEARRAAAAERLIEEYGIGVDEALERESSVVVPADSQPLANRLRREVRAMGSVNVGAIEAYERLSSRHDELSTQRTDIVDGIEQVRASMRELDKLTRDKFQETFTKVEQAYGEIFRKLFGGGEGKIYLDDPASILDSGIEIEVTLPGKKRQRLELLSGGERALCATGFLFALLQVKPSPLVVLDEVDAPLDGRNVERFADLLQEFTDRTQFIVITHNPTTIERAPVWLGVTMQEPGVSTMIPAKLPSRAVVEVSAHGPQPSMQLDPAHS
ncbi:MAG: chromosome segregation protein SMC [Fimbriimonadales bacterium]